MLLAIGGGVAAGYLCGGRLRSLQWIPGWFLIVPWVAVVAQAALTHLVSGDARGVAVTALVATYLLAAATLFALWCVVRGRERSARLQLAIGVILLGWALNTTVIAANGGMPVSGSALRKAGYTATVEEIEHVRKHVPSSSETSLAWLGDVIPIPPLRRVVSLGDVVVLMGIAGLLAAGMTARETAAPNAMGGGPSTRGARAPTWSTRRLGDR